MPNKYHEALTCAIAAINAEISYLIKEFGQDTKMVTYRFECIDKLADLQKAIDKIAQLKQSLKELDLEESK